MEDTAFEDPKPEPKTTPDPGEINPSQTLFFESETPKAPGSSVERKPTAKAVANALNSSPALTWQSARERLKAFGIKEYYLQPDPAGQQFLFRCTYTPPGNPRINRLFEAEAADPLEAVQKVLAQLESSTIRQTASAN